MPEKNGFGWESAHCDARLTSKKRATASAHPAQQSDLAPCAPGPHHRRRVAGTAHSCLPHLRCICYVDTSSHVTPPTCKAAGKYSLSSNLCGTDEVGVTKHSVPQYLQQREQHPEYGREALSQGCTGRVLFSLRDRPRPFHECTRARVAEDSRTRDVFFCKNEH